jgi:hypothetical protein
MSIPQILDVANFGAVGDNSTDDTAAFQAAFNALSFLGGQVTYTKQHYIAGTLSIPNYCTLKGPLSLTVFGPTGAAALPTQACLSLSTKPITCGVGSGIDGCLIVPAGMTFPQTNSSSWTGTAVWLLGSDGFVFNSHIMGFNQAIIGGPVGYFTGSISGTTLTVTNVSAGTVVPGTALYAAGGGTPSANTIISPYGTGGTTGTGGTGTYQVSISQTLASTALKSALGNTNGSGAHFNNLKIDCVNGILVNNPDDTVHGYACEAFPYATLGQSGTPPSNWLDRLGVAFSFVQTVTATGGNATLYDCFSYGYQTGFLLNGCNNALLDGCWADGTNQLGTAVGFSVVGNSYGGDQNYIRGCTTTGQQTGYKCESNVGTSTTFSDCQVSACEAVKNYTGNFAFVVYSGDCYIENCKVRGSGGSGYTSSAVYSSASSANNLYISNLVSQGLNGDLASPIWNNNGSNVVFTQLNNDYHDFPLPASPIYNYVLPTVASASLISLPLNGDVFSVTGNTTITGLQGGYPGRKVYLLFDAGSITVDHGLATANGILLANAQNSTFAQYSVLSLIYDGGQSRWTQVGSLSENVQLFTSSGTWTAANPNYKSVRAIGFGAAGGGGSGAKTASGTASSGGGGGGGGGSFDTTWNSGLTSPQTVTVGTGGTGGTGVSTAGAGNNGGSGGATTFNNVLAGGGGPGFGGAVGANSYGGGSGSWQGSSANQYAPNAGVNGGFGSAGANAYASGTGGGGAGGTNGAAGSTGGLSYNGGPGGGCGGGISTTPAAFSGGSGSANQWNNSFPAPGTAGNPGTGGAANDSTAAGTSGGGGGSSITGNGGAGGAGSTAAGGGGGGSCIGTFTSGAGAGGGNGLVLIIETY